jgi:hypothetical protein
MDSWGDLADLSSSDDSDFESEESSQSSQGGSLNPKKDVPVGDEYQVRMLFCFLFFLFFFYPSSSSFLSLIQVVVPRIGQLEAKSTQPDKGTLVWCADQCPRPKAAVYDWLDNLCAQAGAREGRGRIIAHALEVLHCWNYDLTAVKRDWEKILKLKPQPLIGKLRWSKQDTYALQQIQQWFPDLWEYVAENSLTSHSLEEIKERNFYLQGEEHYLKHRPVVQAVPYVHKRRKLLDNINYHNQRVGEERDSE